MAARPRVVSLLPSATEIAVAVGLGDALVGRSHECDFPPFVADLPVCTATKLEKGLTSRQIEDRVQEIVRQGLSVYSVDAPLLRSLKPDVILTQSQCAVCAVTPADLVEALADWTGTAPILLSLAPDDLGDVWGDFRRVGEAVGAPQAAEAAVAQCQTRLEALRVPAAAPRPRVAAVEWIDPLMAAGNWVPELIEIAGGTALFAAAGAAFTVAGMGCVRRRRSRRNRDDAVRLPDPADLGGPRPADAARGLARSGGGAREPRVRGGRAPFLQSPRAPGWWNRRRFWRRCCTIRMRMRAAAGGGWSRRPPEAYPPSPHKVARPRNEKKPITSVAIVTNTAEDTAGSTPAFSSPTGTSTPARPAIRLLMTIAIAITVARSPLP